MRLGDLHNEMRQRELDLSQNEDQQLLLLIKDNLNFDQMIWEFGTDVNPDWVHVSYDSAGKQRKQILKAIKKGGKTIYAPYK